MQGRFKRDGSAAADPELPGGTTHSSDASARTNAKGAGDSGDAKKKVPSGPGTRIALRNWRISTRLVSLLALPVVAATTLGGLRIESSMSNIEQLEHMKLLTDMTEQATKLADALQEERDKSAGPLAGAGDAKDDRVVAPREKTERAIQTFNAATGDIKTDDPTMDGVRSTVLDISRQLGTIQSVREKAYANDDYIAQTITNYNALITSLLALSQDMAQATSNPEMIRSTRALAAFSSAKEYASIQRAVITAGLAHKDGPRLSANDRAYGGTAEENERAALKRFSRLYPSASELTRGLDEGIVEIQSADTFAGRAFKTPGGIKAENRSYMDWYDQDSNKIDEMSKIETTLLSQMDQKARELQSAATQDALINGVVILLVLGISLVGAFVVARSMVRSLRRLQETAKTVAQERLPELVKQLSEGDPQEVDTSVESVGVHSRDEIGQVAAAFDEVHREAVRLASEQAMLRGNVNAMFTNLSRRSQGLIQRQLSLISELESREADPDQLSSLFKLDHLATRMRRNGENLLVLAGEEPGRRWTRPVPLVDVLRAAASEVDQYERVELTAVPTTEVAGRVVNDLVHLIAELLENATSFSSPQTKVKVTGHALPDGRVLVEIHDTGIGLSPEDLSAINERLASPPTVDVSVSRRMGLFVVGRLSLRHGIRIQLRPSDSGGTTALVMLPVDVAQGGKKPVPTKAQNAPAMGGQGQGGRGGLSGMQPRGQVGQGNTSAPGGQGGAAGWAGGAEPRGQVGGGQRPALPGRGQGNGQPNGGGLPTRTGSAAGNGGHGGSPQGSAFAGTGNAFAGGGRPGTPNAAPSGSGFGSGDAFGGNRTNAPGGAAPGQNDSGQRPPLPPRGGSPSVAPPTGAPGQSGGAHSAGSQGRRPQLPPRGPAAELPGGSAPSGRSTPPDQNSQNEQNGQAGSSWRARQQGSAPADDWPTTPRPAEDTPRGHEDHENTGRPPRPESTGSYQPQRPGTQQPGTQTGTQQNSSQPSPTLGGRIQGGPADTAAFVRPDFGAQRPQQSGPPQNALQQDGGFGARQSQGPGDTAEFVPPDFDGPPPGRTPRADSAPQARPTPNLPVPNRPAPNLPQPRQDRGDFQLPPGALPPAGPGDGRTPIFEAIESNWFRGPGGSEAPAAPTPPAQPAQAAPSASAATAPTAPAAPTMPRREPASATGTSGGTGGGNGAANGNSWRTSPNDERWRQAEQVREPAAGGVTSSGLPVRVPRANLVAGTAQQQSHSTGPQVSRAPSDVRGRLTNLRRGIQQGREVGNGPGTDGRGIDPTYQQER
ncbi:sensor histidine kinase [Streptomyces sp. H27-D2]|uniref:sensor histidine kinase n=1 Tax=Streptomyces sp. H27-D2 TaxID=3046304 RepID=UPI002DBD75F0|nr:nitrate- and nitrite sensing domain-containing protein [Streptomyces sp. H27-D2]MEC4017265.1 nitrate- and nitrite sensing domain-containing protein [Streptomyces sp. H27-D2]